MAVGGRARGTLSVAYFTFVVYLSIGLPLRSADVCAFVHGLSAALAGLVISVQYIATFLSRPWAGHISDHTGREGLGALGMGGCTATLRLLLGAAVLQRCPGWG